MKKIFPKTERIRKAFEYLYLSKYGKKFFGNYLIIITKKNHIGINRLGVTVSKKVGNAVLRNRIKRIIKEYFRNNIKCLLENEDMNVIAKKKIKEIPSYKIFTNIGSDFKEFLNKKNKIYKRTDV